MEKLVLASASPRRRELLSLVGLEYEVLPADIDESVKGYEDAGKYVMDMSRIKAETVRDKLWETGAVPKTVLAADTTVVVDGSILGKPADKQDALRMLNLIGGRWHEVITGITLAHGKSGQVLTQAERTRVKIREISPDFAERYIGTGEPFDKAGSYGIQGFGSLLVEEIEGCYFNVMGLPLYKLSTMLQTLGMTPLSWLSKP